MHGTSSRLSKCAASKAVGQRFAESCQRQIEAAELQFAELERKELAVPTRVQRQLIVGDHIGALLRVGPAEVRKPTQRRQK
jgi:hypothetical protein